MSTDSPEAGDTYYSESYKHFIIFSTKKGVAKNLGGISCILKMTGKIEEMSEPTRYVREISGVGWKYVGNLTYILRKAIDEVPK